MNDLTQQKDTSPGISPELITHLLEKVGNWLIVLPLRQYVTRIAFLLSAFFQLASCISNTNLTPWYGTLIVSVSGHEVRQDKATFMLGLTLMDITSEAVRANVCHLHRECMSQTATHCNLGNLGHP